MITLGILAAYLVALAFPSSWRTLFAVGLIPAGAFLLAVVRCPETPAWLLSHGNEEAARRVGQLEEARLTLTATTDELSAQIQQFIAARERDGVLGLTDRITASEWAEVVPRLDPKEVALSDAARRGELIDRRQLEMNNRVHQQRGRGEQPQRGGSHGAPARQRFAGHVAAQVRTHFTIKTPCMLEWYVQWNG